MEQVIIKTFYNYSVVFTILAYFQKEKVIYKSKTGNDSKEFDAVDFIASICSHIPEKSEQMVRYLGYYSNVCRGKRRKQEADESDCVIENDGYAKAANKSWARLIKKIYEVDLLVCTKCKGQMRIIAFIQNPLFIINSFFLVSALPVLSKLSRYISYLYLRDTKGSSSRKALFRPIKSKLIYRLHIFP